VRSMLLAGTDAAMKTLRGRAGRGVQRRLFVRLS
jgi:hypothetical protein